MWRNEFCNYHFATDTTASTVVNVIAKSRHGFAQVFYYYLCQDYKQFWTSFGKNLKLGCIEDTANHKRLAPLLRFNSSKKEEELISLDEYVEGMKEDQKEIYYLAADSLKSAKSAPFLEELVKRDMEVSSLWIPVSWLLAISSVLLYIFIC